MKCIAFAIICAAYMLVPYSEMKDLSDGFKAVNAVAFVICIIGFLKEINEMTLRYKGIDYDALRRGYQEFEMDDGDILEWPRCEISGCDAGVCIGMSKSLCYQHGIEFGAFTKEQFEADRKKKHAD